MPANQKKDGRYLSDDVRPENVGAKILWLGLMLIAVGAAGLSVLEKFREQSVVIWAQILLAVAGAFGVVTASPDDARHRKSPPLSLWAKWLLLCFSGIPAVLRIPAGEGARQIIGSVVAGGILIGCSFLSTQTEFPFLQSVFGGCTLLFLFLASGWYGENFRWAAVILPIFVLGLALYLRFENQWDDKLSEKLNTVLAVVSLAVLLVMIFLYTPLSGVLGYLNIT